MDTALRISLSAALSDGFPTDLLPTIVAYAAERPYIWTSAPTDSDADWPRIIDNFAANDAEDNWYRLTSSQAVGAGPDHWRIKTVFHRSKPGWIAVGVTAAVAAGCAALPITRPSEHWNDATQKADFVVRTSAAPAFKNNGKPLNFLTLNDGAGDVQAHIRAAVDTETTTVVDFDVSSRTLTVGQVVDGRLESVGRTIPAEFGDLRPAVMVHGCVCVSILPWTS